MLYLLVALAIVALASAEELAASASPLSLAIGKVAPSLTPWLAIIALISTGNTALISLIVASRVLFGMARAEDLPSFLARTLPHRRTPWIAALILLGIATFLLPFGRIEIVASLSSLISLVVFIGVNAALIRLRYHEPELKRPFRVPITIGRCPVLPILAIATSFGLMTQFETEVYIAGAFIIGCIFGLNFARNARA